MTNRSAFSALASCVVVCALVSRAAELPPEALEDEPKTSEPAPLDSTFAAATDSASIRVPASFEPGAVMRRAFLRPDPGAGADSLVGLFAIDAFVVPPEGPASVFDRTDLRLAGTSEWWETVGSVPGAFVREPGYLGLVSAVSFRGHGPEGTLFSVGPSPLMAGVAPLENPNRVSKSSLAGLAVMPVGASHLYGPGAGAGAVTMLPLAQAPDRAYTEVTQLTGIFGQNLGSITTSTRWGRLGFLADYAGSNVNPWSLFGGFRAERASASFDWVQESLRLVARGRTSRERLRGFDIPAKRGDDEDEVVLSAERRFSGGKVIAARAQWSKTALDASGASGETGHDVRRVGGEVLVRRHFRGDSDVGFLGGVFRDRHDRLGASGDRHQLNETTGYALGRTRLRSPRWMIDASLRVDRTETRETIVAPGATASFRGWPRRLAWLHLARTVDRPALFHRTTDFYTQVDQGIDRPRPRGQELTTGVVAAAGIRSSGSLLRGELGVSADAFDRRVAAQDTEGPGDLDEPSATERREVRSAAAWGKLALGPIAAGFVGDLLVETAGIVTTSEGPRAPLDPARAGRLTVRVRHDFFRRHLRLEGEFMGSLVSRASSPVGPIPAQELLTARVTARVLDVVFFYRSENVLGADVLSAAYDESTGFAPLTGQNVSVGLSWVLLD